VTYSPQITAMATQILQRNEFLASLAAFSIELKLTSIQQYKY
jgi:hypothetical protein